MSIIYIGLDDTDNLESRGTGRLARNIAAELAKEYPVLGVTRHQLLEDPRVPCTKRNSTASIMLEATDAWSSEAMLDQVRRMMLADFQEDSDPGLCITAVIPEEILFYGRMVQEQLMPQKVAKELAAANNIPLLGLGGTNDGVIGALAAVGLAASGSDGRYVQVGSIRELSGLQPVSTLLAAGISQVRTETGQVITDGLVLTDKLRPARREGQPICVVKKEDEHWLPLKLN